MNVFRRALTHLPGLGGEEDGEDLAGEVNLYKRDVLRLAAVFVGDSSVDDRVDALARMGHLAYIGRGTYLINKSLRMFENYIVLNLSLVQK